MVDIRDYTQEKFRLYRRAEKRVFAEAAMCVISSPGFRNFLPKAGYHLCHNVDAAAGNICRPPFEKASSRRIILSYIGSISYEEQCRRLIDLVAKDERFEFHLYGNEVNGTEVSSCVETVGCPRIKMMGAFRPDEKARIYRDSDLVFNCYGNDRMLLKYAISNKHYDGALFRKPLLVSPGTSMAEVAGDYAYPLDLGKADNLDGLYRWYRELDPEGYARYTDGVINDALKENAGLAEQIKSCVRNAGGI